MTFMRHFVVSLCVVLVLVSCGGSGDPGLQATIDAQSTRLAMVDSSEQEPDVAPTSVDTPASTTPPIEPAGLNQMLLPGETWQKGETEITLSNATFEPGCRGIFGFQLDIADRSGGMLNGEDIAVYDESDRLFSNVWYESGSPSGQCYDSKLDHLSWNSASEPTVTISFRVVSTPDRGVSRVEVTAPDPSLGTAVWDISALEAQQAAVPVQASETPVITTPQAEVAERAETPEPTSVPSPTVAEPDAVPPEDGPRWFKLGNPIGRDLGEPTSMSISAADPNYRYVSLGDRGLMVSDDAGQTWTNVYAELKRFKSTDSIEVQDVKADPTSGPGLFTLVNGSLLFSKDMGMTWQPPTGLGRVLAFDVGAQGRLLYAREASRVSVSQDGGRTFAGSYRLPEDDSYAGLYHMAVDAEDDSTAYVIANGNLYQTNSGGMTWSSPSIFNAVSVGGVIADGSESGLAYVLTGAHSLYRTLDGGESWGLIADLNTVANFAALRLLAAEAGAIHLQGHWYLDHDRIASFDRGVTWETMEEGAIVTEILRMYRDPKVEGLFYGLKNAGDYMAPWLLASTRDNGLTWEDCLPAGVSRLTVSPDGRNMYASGERVITSSDGGKSWRHCGEIGGRGVALDPSDPRIVYLYTLSLGTSGVYKTNDGGDTWNLVADTPREQGGIGLAVNPGDPDFVYHLEPPLVSSDAGATWSTLGDETKSYMFAVAVNPQNPMHVLFGYNGFDGGLYWSTDSGMTVQVRGLSNDFKIHSIAYDPSNTDTVYAVAEAGDSVDLWRSDDEGGSWEVVSNLNDVGSPAGGGYVHSTFYGDLFVDPRDSDVIYLVRSLPFLSIDGGRTWQELGLGLTPSEPLTDAELIVGNDALTLLAPSGSGIWRLELPDR